MNTNELKALTYITEVAVEELTILQWLKILSSIYTEGIPEEAKFGEAINTYIEQFSNFSELAKDCSQEGLDRIYDEFLKFVNAKIK